MSIAKRVAEALDKMTAGDLEAALLANQAQNPVDHMTGLQREMLKEQQKLNQNAKHQIQELRQNRPVPALVADLNE